MIEIVWDNSTNFHIDWHNDPDCTTPEITEQLYALIMGWA